MVSIRRRRYLGLCSGKSSLAVDRYNPVKNSDAAEHFKLGSVHPMPSDNGNIQELVNKSEEPSNTLAPAMSKEPNEHCPVKEIKRRKRHRRKQCEDQERYVMRGVYFKNTKWQAAIKVDKRQIHLGTVGSQEEAARLYDRAAFMCGRQPNSELSEEEKKELSLYSWEEFLALTRSAISSKKNQRKLSAGKQGDSEQEPGSSSMSETNGDDATIDSVLQ